MARKPADPELESAIALALELFEPLGDLRARKMFGGAGVYCAGRMFALLADGLIYLKTDAVSRDQFAAAGSTPFVFETRDGSSATMSYWRLPDTALDDADEALAWGRLGLEAALRG
jgi:DNA transformation protein and related proteins